MNGRFLIDQQNAEALEDPIFICVISQELMTDAVMTLCGHTFSRRGITTWLADHSTCPCCRNNLPNKTLIPNFALIDAITRWKEDQIKIQRQNQEIRDLRKLIPDPIPRIIEEKHVQLDQTVEEQTNIIRAVESEISKKARQISATLFLRRALRKRAIQAIGSDPKELDNEVKEPSLNIAAPGIANQVEQLRQQFHALIQNNTIKKNELKHKTQALSQKINPESAEDRRAMQDLLQNMDQLNKQHLQDRKNLERQLAHFLKYDVQPLIGHKLPQLLRLNKLLKQQTPN